MCMPCHKPFRLCRMLHLEAFKKTPCRKSTHSHLGIDGTDAALRPMHDALTYASFTSAHSASVTCTDTECRFLKSGKLSLRVALHYRDVGLSLSTVGFFAERTPIVDLSHGVACNIHAHSHFVALRLSEPGITRLASHRLGTSSHWLLL